MSAHRLVPHLVRWWSIRALAGSMIVILLAARVATAGTLTVVGTGDGVDVLRALAEAYTNAHPEVIVDVPPSIGSGGGIAAVGADREIMARIARPLSASETEQGIVAVPVLRIPSAFFIHPGTGVTALSSEAVAAIYRGEITNWRDVGGADLKIRLVRREDADSTLTVLRASMPGWKNLILSPRSKTALTTQDAIETVRTVEGTIGFGPFTQTLEHGTTVLKVDGRHPSASDYPSAVVVSYIYKPERLTDEARDFIRFTGSEVAARIIAGFGGQPLANRSVP